MKRNRIFYFSIVYVIVVINPLFAQSIIYTFSGECDGRLEDSYFYNVDYEVVIQGDTQDVVWAPHPTDDVAVIINLSGFIEIEGEGVASLTLPLYVFCNQSMNVLGFGNSGNSGSSYHLDLIDLDGLGDVFNNYELKMSYGPILDTTPRYSQFGDVETDRGLLTLSPVHDVTFQAELIPDRLLLRCALRGTRRPS
jgi:hypothetical protein